MSVLKSMAGLFVCAALASCVEGGDFEADETTEAVTAVDRYSALSMGEAFGCALGKDGQAYCWGSDSEGQLGDGATTNRTIPTAVPTTSNQLGISAGGFHACTVAADGHMRCWGRNTYGQLGNGSTSATSAPVAVVSPPQYGITAVQVAAGYNHTCALDERNVVFCWGSNGWGQLGTGSASPASSAIPVMVRNAAGTPIAIASGDTHSCFLATSGKVLCWGANVYGQLGDGTTTNRNFPDWVANVTDAVAISAGRNDSCAILANHTVKCWGNNFNGQLGSGASTAPHTTPTLVIGPTGSGALDHVVKVTHGYAHTCALRDDGSAYCWGWNGWGQLGGPTQSYPPVLVTSGTYNTLHSNPITDIASNGNSTCVRSGDGNFWCFGQNSYGQLGDGTTTSRSVPTWNFIPQYITSGAQAVGGSAHACALTSGGGVRCWGENLHGQLGDGTRTTRLSPVAVSGVANAIAITASDASTCALLADHTAKCWGSNYLGQIDGVASDDKLTPVAVPGLNTVVQVSAGPNHSCAVLANGTARCWGYNMYGQIGDGSTTLGRPVTQVFGLSNAVRIVAGGFSTCALLADRTLKCWGYNGTGALGDGTHTDRSIPAVGPSLTNIDAFSVGDFHACAAGDAADLYPTGVWCWGSNGNGQLGNGTTVGSATPVRAVALSGGTTIHLGRATDVTAGLATTCTTSGDAVYCWGNNSAGVGDGTGTERVYATLIPQATDHPIMISGYRTMCAANVENEVKCWGAGYAGNGSSTHPLLSPPVWPIAIP